MPCTYLGHPGTRNEGIYVAGYAAPYVLQWHVSCSRVFTCSARCRRLLALASPRAASGTTVAVRARRYPQLNRRSSIATRRRRHSHSSSRTRTRPRCLLCTDRARVAGNIFAQGYSRRRRCAPKEQYRFSVPRSCSTREASFLFRTSVSLWPAHFFFSFLPRASPRQHAHAHALRTRRRPTTNDATCGPPAWLTGRLHKGGTRSVRSPLRRPPLLATPIATPLQGGRPERSDLLFLELLMMPL